MSDKIRGKLIRDVRLNGEGKEDGSGRLFLRGEFASVHKDLAHLVDAQAEPKSQLRYKTTQLKAKVEK